MLAQFVVKFSAKVKNGTRGGILVTLAYVASIKEMVESTELQWHIHSLIHSFIHSFIHQLHEKENWLILAYNALCITHVYFNVFDRSPPDLTLI